MTNKFSSLIKMSLAPRADKIMRNEDDAYPNLFAQSGITQTYLYRKTTIPGQLISSLAEVQYQNTATLASADWSFGGAAPFTATYTGSRTKKLIVNVTSDLVRNVANANAFIGVYVNDVLIDGKAITTRQSNGDITHLSVACIVSIAQGQTLKVKAESTGVPEIQPTTVLTQTSIACSISAVEILAP